MNRMHKRYVRIASTAVAVTVALSATACGGSGTASESKQQRQDSNQIVNNQPLPNIPYSVMRQNMIQIEEAEAKGTATTSFFFNNGVTNPIGSCTSVGVPIPNTASLSNPLKPDTGGTNSVTSVGQMDPNGVYVPGSSSGTWVICLGRGGAPYPVYWEGNVHAVFAPAVWNESTHSIEITGPLSLTLNTGIPRQYQAQMNKLNP